MSNIHSLSFGQWNIHTVLADTNNVTGQLPINIKEDLRNKENKHHNKNEKKNMQPQIDPIIYLVGGGKLSPIRKDMN